MQKRNRSLATLMARHGYILVREKNHAIWRNPQTGRQVVTSRTSSDQRARKNILMTVHRQEGK
jgi:hypothetical protein